MPKHTKGFIGGLIGFGLGLVVSFSLTVAVRSAYNHATAEFDDSREIDTIGMAYRSLLNMPEYTASVPFVEVDIDSNGETVYCATKLSHAVLPVIEEGSKEGCCGSDCGNCIAVECRQ
tara:strand:- start:62530 stop:62883 length:354 start_codon:yes stop_codon:yes gene_type:complete